MNEKLKLIICFVVAIIIVSLLSPLWKLIGVVLGLILWTLIAYFGISWLANKFNWKWW